MNKLFNKIATITLGLAMAIGVGTAIGGKGSGVRSVGAEVVTTDKAFTGDTVTFSGLSLTNGDQYTGDFTNAADKNTFKVNFTGGDNDGKYYTTGAGIRTYANGSVTVTALNSGTLTEVVFTFSGSSYAAPSNIITGYSLSNNVGTWTGSDSSITLTRGTGSGHWRLQSVNATVSSGSTSYNYTITYNANGSSDPITGDNPQTGSGTSVTLYNCQLTKNGAIHDGWATSTSGNREYTLGQTITLSGNLTTTLYAHWTPVYTITFNENGGSGTVPPQQTGNGSVDLPSSASLTKTDYILDGWGDSSHKDDTNAQYALGASYNLTASITLYAHWTRVYTVSFDRNGGTGTMASVPDIHGTYTLPTSTFTPPGTKSFAGWKANNLGDLIAAGGTYNVSADVTFYAQWANVITDVITAADLKSTSSGSYVAFSNVTKNSDAIYLGKTANDNGRIQCNATSGNGIATSGSGGKIKSISVSWGTISSGRGYNVYGKSTSYSSVGTSGTLLGSLNQTTTTITVSGDYEYVSLQGYGGASYAASLTFVWEAPQKDPEIKSVTVSGGPASATIDGGSQFSITATVTTAYDDEHTLDTRVNWSVNRDGAVSFSKSTSDSGETITVTATNGNYNGVIITATSVQEGFTDKTGSSSSFNIIKVYVVDSVSLSYTTEGGPSYDAGGASNFDVSFTTAVNYTGDEGTKKVNITVSPDTGVTGQGNNKTAGDFTLNFTVSGNYTITSTSVENSAKSRSVNITVSNIVAPGYELVTSVGSLRNGLKVIIHSSGDTYNRFMTGAASDYRYMSGTNYIVSGGFIPEADVDSDVEVLTLVVSGSHWNLKTHDDKYLSLTNDENKLYTVGSLNGTSTQWDISFVGNNANITSVAQSARTIRCNTSSSRFACYAGTQQAIQLYAEVDTSPYFTVNTTATFLGNRGSQQLILTPHNGATDTITWSSSNDNLVSVSPTSGLTTTVTAAETGTGDVTITASFASEDFEDIEVTVTVMELDTYVNVGVTTFTKVTSDPGDWTGTYLLVDETSEIIFDGSASPLVANSEKSVTISNNQIDATGLITSSFNIKTSTNGYTLKSNSNYYVGNQSITNGIMTNVGIEYEVSIDSDGTITALLQDGTSSNTTIRHNSGDHIFRFYTGTSGNGIALYKANGDMRAITDTITDWYDNAKANGYLNCNMAGEGSSINWSALSSGSFYTALTLTDKDTLKRMTAKSAEDNGNYLEDFISDYDYLVSHKRYTDFLERFQVGGAMYGHGIYKPVTIIDSKTVNASLIVVVTSIISVAAVGGYFFLRKKKEQ